MSTGSGMSDQLLTGGGTMPGGMSTLTGFPPELPQQAGLMGMVGAGGDGRNLLQVCAACAAPY